MIKIISGGQTGVDQAALRAAKAIGLPTGGWVPKGFRAQDGFHPEFREMYGMVEDGHYQYPPRTRKNVYDADATLILGNAGSAGCKLTAKLCAELNKPYLAMPWTDNLSTSVLVIKDFISRVRPSVLSVAGNREESYPGIGAWAEGVLISVLK